MESTDKDTIAALRAGDHEAFERVFIAYFGRVKSFIYGYIKSDADAEDLAEDLFVGLWINRAAIDPTRSFDAYLHTIARNAALNFLRRKLVRLAHENSPAPLAETEGTPGPEDELIARETAMLIEMAVDRMPSQRREIYRLSRGTGLKNDEIADRLGTTKRNVESQLSLALKEIRRAVMTVFLLFP